jgi:integral membrane protein
MRTPPSLSQPPDTPQHGGARRRTGTVAYRHGVSSSEGRAPATQPAAGGAARPAPEGLAGTLLRYRVMAFVTGVVLICGVIALIVKDVFDVQHMEPGTGILWVAHGYLFLVYVIASVHLGFKLRWNIIRIAVVCACGTIPTMSFVAEHFVTRKVRADYPTR